MKRLVVLAALLSSPPAGADPAADADASWGAFRKALREFDVPAVWEAVDAEPREKAAADIRKERDSFFDWDPIIVSKYARIARRTVEELKALPADEFVRVMFAAKLRYAYDTVTSARTKEIKIDGDRALVKVEREGTDGHQMIETWPMVKRGEAWKVAAVKGESPDADCLDTCRQLGVYLALFEAQSRRYPTTIGEMKSPDLLSEEAKSRCPVHPEDPDSYVYLYPYGGDNTSPDWIILYDRFAHSDGSRSVLMFQGRAVKMTETEFHEALTAQFTDNRKKMQKALDRAAAEPELKDAAAEKVRVARLEALKSLVKAMEEELAPAKK